MVNPELIKLASLVVAAVVIGGGGQFLINKKRKSKKERSENYSDFSSQDNSYEDSAKAYILEYKGTYPRESIKMGLKNMGIEEAMAEDYLNRFM